MCCIGIQATNSWFDYKGCDWGWKLDDVTQEDCDGRFCGRGPRVHKTVALAFAKTESWQKTNVGRRWAHQWQNGTSKILFPNVPDRAFHWGAKRFDFQKIICSLFHSQWIRKNSTIFLKDGFITVWLTWWLTCLFPTKHATENNLKTSLQLGNVPLCCQTFQTWQTYVHEILSNS